jgi:dihydrofolate reductase
MRVLLDQGATMPKLVARCIAVSIDGFSAARGQALDAPFGKDGLRLMQWARVTKSFAKMVGQDGGGEGLDNDFFAHAFDGIGATIMGRNMFGPQRGPWPNDDWKGWWGPNPPFHHPVFVLSHHAHASFGMEGGTSFSFVNDGIQSALEQAFAAAQGRDVRIGGGAFTISQYLKAGFLDELHVVLVPILLGSGEKIFDGLDELSDRYEVVEYTPSKTVAHVRIAKKAE